MKILVPSVVAGAIIGKGGETIAQIQKEAGARVKMSKANDFYPGEQFVSELPLYSCLGCANTAYGNYFDSFYPIQPIDCAGTYIFSPQLRVDTWFQIVLDNPV